MRTLVLIFALTAVAAAAPKAFAVELGDTCGTVAALTCDEGLWCEPRPGSCGQTNPIGTCVRATNKCPRNFNPVCGCNGRTYSNNCVRRVEKTGLDYAGQCWTDQVK